MTTAYTLVVTFSLILGMTGCQTLNNNQDKTGKVESNTDLSIAAAFLESGQPDKAMFELRLVLEREPKNIRAQTLMGLSQLALKNPRKAVQHLESAWNIAPTAVNALNLSSAYIESGQLDKAQKIITKGLSLKEAPPYRNVERFYHNLGLVAEKRGALVAAEKSYRKALEENPTFYLSRSRLASLLEEQKKYDSAKIQWEQARLSCPGCFEATERLAAYYKSHDDLKTALGIVQDYRRIEGLKLSDAKNAEELESQLKAERMKSARQSINHTGGENSR
jgi:Tfp pilus assembly protein PilF